MKLDVRTPIGALFAVDGVLLIIHAATADPGEAIAKAGSNITLGWGVLLLTFGVILLGLAWRRRRR